MSSLKEDTVSNAELFSKMPECLKLLGQMLSSQRLTMDDIMWHAAVAWRNCSQVLSVRADDV